MKLLDLPNGLRIVLDHLPFVQTVSVGVWCDVGARHEPQEMNGISHFLEHLKFKGTSKRNVTQLLNDVDRFGGHFNATTGPEKTNYYVTCLAENVVDALEFVGEIVSDSIYPEEEIEKERGVILQELMMCQDHPDGVAGEAVMRVALPNQALGRTILGPEENIQNFTRDDFVKYHDEKYCPDKMVLVISGNLMGKEDELMVLANKYFGSLNTKSNATLEPFTYSPGYEAVVRNEINQVNVDLVFPCVGIMDDDRYATNVLAKLLGGSMSSRLMTEVREKRGLCYGIGAYAMLYRDGGLFSIYSGTTADNANELLTATAQEILKIVHEDATDDEIVRAMALTKSGIVSSFESTLSRAYYFANGVLNHGKLHDVEKQLESYNAVTAADVRRVAETIFTKEPAIGLCGPVGEVMDFGELCSAFK